VTPEAQTNLRPCRRFPLIEGLVARAFHSLFLFELPRSLELESHSKVLKLHPEKLINA